MHSQILVTSAQARDIAFADGEIAWGDWMSAEDLQHLLSQRASDFVPDGLQVRIHYNILI